MQDADDIDSAVSCWYSTFLSTIRGMIPCKRISHIKPKNPLIAPDIEKAIKDKKKKEKRKNSLACAEKADH